MLLPAALLPVALVALIWVLPWENELIYSSFERVTDRPPDTAELDTPMFTRHVDHFVSQGTRCEAWLYTPKQSRFCCSRSESEDSQCDVTHECKLPVVILAHGLGGQKVWLRLHGEKPTAIIRTPKALFALAAALSNAIYEYEDVRVISLFKIRKYVDVCWIRPLL